MFGGSRNPVVDIGISMTLQDRFSGPAGNIVSSWRGMMEDMNSFSSGMSRAFSSNLSAGVGIMKGMYSAFEYSSKIQKNIRLTNEMINDGDNMKELTKLAKDINLTNPLNLDDITSGERFMAMAGMGLEQIKGALKPAADLAAIFGEQLGGKGGTADLMTNIMATFQKAPEEASKVADILGVGTTSANIGIQDLAQTVKYLGANARMAGMSLEEVVAVAGVLGNRGLQGSIAGTNTGQGLVQLMMGISGKHKKAASALAQLGLSKEDLTDAQGNLLRIDQILKMVGEKLSSYGGVDKTGIFQDLFGRRGTRAMNILIEDLSKFDSQFGSIMNKLQGSSGWTSKTMEKVMDDPDGRIKAMKASIDNLVYTIGDNLKIVFSPLVKGVTWILSKLDSFVESGFGKYVTGFAFLATTAGIIRNGFKYISTYVKFMTGGLTTSVGASGGLQRNLAGTRIQAAGITAELRAQYMMMAQMAIMMKGGGRISPFLGSKVRIGMYKGSPTFFRAGKKSKGWDPVDPVLANRYLNRYYGYGMGVPAGGTSKYGVPGATVPVNPAANNLLTRGLTRAFGSTIGSGVGKLATVFGRGVLAITGGPWGLGISAALTFLPMIWSWLSGSDEDKQQEELDARQAARDAEIVRAIKEGKGALVSINLNGNPIGNFGPGDSADIDLFGNADQEYGMDF